MLSSRKAIGCAALMLSATAGWALAGGPPNDFCSDPSLVQCGATSGNNGTASGSTPHVNCGTGDASSRNVWHEFVAPITGSYRITTDSGFDAVLAVFTGCEGQQLACNDDGLEFAGDAVIDIVLSSGQRVLIEVASFGSTPGGAFTLNIECPETGCCQPWDNGRFDRRNAQTSQIGFGEDWRLVGRVTADDFWLCEGNVYRIGSVSGQLTTDSVVPKADVIILEDCDGLPGEVVAAAFSVPPTDLPDSVECLIGEVTISETGQTTDDGFRIIDVHANWDRLFLKGGAYWVIIYGYSGTADPDEQFFWGTSGNQRVKGRPGQFAEFNGELGMVEWISIDEICCGCTDFNFCVQGEECKILLDNGLPRLDARGEGGAIAGPSFSSQGNVATKVRTADQFVVPPCSEAYLCYIEAWVWTNCDTIGLELYSDTCHLPDEGGPIATFTAQCIFDTEIVRNLGGQNVTLRKAVFFANGRDDLLGGNGGRGYRLEGGHNYWLSAYADGTGRQNGRGFFAFNSFCDRECWNNFDPSATKGPPYATSRWNSNYDDNAFLVAIHHVATVVGGPEGGSDPVCAGDFNRDGTASIQDLFDFLAAYFAGCP